MRHHPARASLSVHAILGCLMLAASPAPADTWAELAPMIFDGRPLLDGAGIVALDSPYRTDNDARTRIAARVAAPPGTGLARLTLVLDENPMPVSAQFDFAAPVPRFAFDATFRINGPTPLHLVAELDDGRLLAVDGFVKTSGQGACAAPPGTDPETALATLGQMTLSLAPPAAATPAERLAALAHGENRLDIDISHPSHSGLQMNQITLLFIPMRYVETLEIALDGQPDVTVTGSISLSENPHLALSVPATARSAEVTLHDTDGTLTRAEVALPGY